MKKASFKRRLLFGLFYLVIVFFYEHLKNRKARRARGPAVRLFI
jgi:hypothetical protein